MERAVSLAREREARAEAEAANHAKDEFLATVTHDLRGPLSTILGWVRVWRAGRLDRSGSQARIAVSDTGRGISQEFLPYVFDRFSQADSADARKHGGLGLGLAIVRSLVELHGGSVRVESDGVGQGATFTVMFPLAAEPLELEEAERMVAR